MPLWYLKVKLCNTVKVYLFVYLFCTVLLYSYVFFAFFDLLGVSTSVKGNQTDHDDSE